MIPGAVFMVAEFEEVCTQFQGKMVSLIAGMEYGMEQWNGRWNGRVNVHSYSLTRVAGAVLQG